MSGWNEALHPRAPKGTATGGQFTSGGGSYSQEQFRVAQAEERKARYAVAKVRERGYRVNRAKPGWMAKELEHQAQFRQLQKTHDKAQKRLTTIGNALYGKRKP